MTSLPTLALTSSLPFLLLFVTHAGASLRGWKPPSSTGSSLPSSDEGGVSRASPLSKVDHNNDNNRSGGASNQQQGFLNTDTVTILPKPPQDSSLSHTIANTNYNSGSLSSITTNAPTKRFKPPPPPAAHVRGISSEVGTMCAYRLLEQGSTEQLCFRQTQRHFPCPSADCQRVKSPGGHLVANMFTNGSVLIQWTVRDTWLVAGRRVQQSVAAEQQRTLHRAHRTAQEAPTAKGIEPEEQEQELEGASVTTTNTIQPSVPDHEGGGGGEGGEGGRRRYSRRHGHGGFKLSCWWNGSYTQFECTGVQLGSSCRDYMLNELHDNVPYRICLQPLEAVYQGQGQGQGSALAGGGGDDCVEFSISPTGMQDIVIAMTTVGGAICVMLVIICLLVAYITENIMSPTSHTHTHTHLAHTRR
ncbi:uncharacterized protein fndc10 [Engraulis encrasicolus]|uniref:uncharacterized protein fndc10 n=1 Tax=Engraulis encrasicolus TaxID=184585 RepID=UPI002FD087C8